MAVAPSIELGDLFCVPKKKGLSPVTNEIIVYRTLREAQDGIAASLRSGLNAGFDGVRLGAHHMFVILDREQTSAGFQTDIWRVLFTEPPFVRSDQQVGWIWCPNFRLFVKKVTL